MELSKFPEGVVLVGEQALALETFAVACDTDVSVVLVLVDEGLVHPESFDEGMRFSGEALARARRVLRLQRDFGANLESVAVMIDLLDEIERLRGQLLRSGVRIP
jgi:chaperone modulatory protein CbpM